MEALLVAGGVALLLEFVLFLAAPGELARAAFLPIGLARDVRLSDAARRAMTVEAGVAPTYREPPRRVVSLARLRRALGAGRFAFEGATLRLDEAGRLSLRCYDVRLRGRRARRPWMLARFVARLHGDVLALRVRCLPVPFVGLALVSVGAALSPPFEARSVVVGLLVVGAVVAVNLAWNRWLVRAALDFLEDELTGRAA